METTAQKPENMLVSMIDESFQNLFMLYIILMNSNLTRNILFNIHLRLKVCPIKGHKLNLFPYMLNYVFYI